MNLTNRARETFAALAVRDFRIQWTASLLSTAAFMTTFVLVPVVGYDLTGSFAASGLAAMGNGVGMLFLTPFGGVLADRMAKKPLVIIGQIVSFVIIAGTGVLIVTDLITVPLLFLSTLASGSAFALTGPARQSWVAELVPQRLLPNAVALQQMGINVAQVLGPTAASVAVLTSEINVGLIYLAAATVFIIALPLTFLLPRTPPAVQSGRAPLRELRDGFSYLRRSPRLRSLWLFCLLTVACGFSIQTLMPGLLDQEFGRSSSEAIVINSIFGVSALLVNVPLAGLVSGRLAWPLLLGMALLLGLGYALVGAAPTFLLLLVFCAIGGAGRSGVLLVNQSLMMTNTRPDYFGRVTAYILMSFGFSSVIGPVWGFAADLVGGRGALYLVALIVAGATLLMGLVWLRLRRLPAEPGTAAAMLESGPPPPAQSPEPPAPSEPPAPLPTPAPSPAYSPLFAARLAPVALMEGQKPRAAAVSAD